MSRVMVVYPYLSLPFVCMCGNGREGREKQRIKFSKVTLRYTGEEIR
jgi:hypothetical protein